MLAWYPALAAWLRRPLLPRGHRPLIARSGNLAGAVSIALLIAVWPTLGHAQARQGKSYYFQLSNTKLAEGIPGEVGELVRTQLGEAIAAHERLVGALPEDAPDPQEAPQAFLRYVQRRGLEPFRVNVEITRFRQEVEPAPRGAGQRLTVSIDLHLFGETMPKRVIGFSGEGSATIKLEVGKRLRDRDSDVARKEAVSLAVADALATSIQRLDEKARRGRGKKK